MEVKERGLGGFFGEEEIEIIRKIITEGISFSVGPYIETFEKEFANYCQAQYAVSCNSGTSALLIATHLLGLKTGDEIIATPQTYHATIFPALMMGAHVKFADIDDETLNISPCSLEKTITEKTKAIFVTHYGGNPVEMDEVALIAQKFGIPVIEDAAHAVGTVYHEKKIGSISDFTCFSFGSMKNMTTLGEGGMILVKNNEDFYKARRIVDTEIIGKLEKRAKKKIGQWNLASPPLIDHSFGAFEFDLTELSNFGGNYRISEIQAAVGLLQLKRLDTFNAMRRKAANWYHQYLEEIEEIRLWKTKDGCLNSFHLYPIFLKDNLKQDIHDQIINFLHHHKHIDIIQRYFPLHLSNYMRFKGHQLGECEICEKVWFLEQINLPIHPLMEEEEVVYIADSLKEAIVNIDA